jgi:large subunit ribosomal protein L14e
LDGPCTGVPRQARRFTELHLTGLVTKVTRGCTERALRLAWEADKITDKWLATSWARRIEKREKVISFSFSKRSSEGFHLEFFCVYDITSLN